MSRRPSALPRAIVLLLPLAIAMLPMAIVQWAAIRLNLRLAHTLPVRFHRMALRVLGVRVTVTGTPEAGRPLLIAANHTSWLDIVVLGSLFPLSFVAKSEVAGWPLFGMLSKLQRTVFVEREKRARTGHQAREIAARLSDGDAMVLFAEGTTSDGNHVLPFRSALIGAARAAVDAGGHAHVLVQPVAIAYTRVQGLPMGRQWRPLVAWIGDQDLPGHFLRILAEGAVDVTVAFGEPITFDRDGDRKRVTRAAETTVRRLHANALGNG